MIFPFFGVSLLKLNGRKKGTPIMNGLLGNLVNSNPERILTLPRPNLRLYLEGLMGDVELPYE